MDVSGFLIGSGFALLIVLLGWVDQFVTKSKDTKEIEKNFLSKANIKVEQYKKIKEDAGSTEESLSALIDFLYSTEEENIELFEKIKEIKVDIRTLEKKYRIRFWILLFLNITLFVTGIFSLFLCKQQALWTLLPTLLFVIIIFINLVETYNLENRYTKNICALMEKL